MGKIATLEISMKYTKNGHRKQKKFKTYAHLGKFIAENHYRMKIEEIKVKNDYGTSKTIKD